jgi:hypothetical protein
VQVALDKHAGIVQASLGGVATTQGKDILGPPGRPVLEATMDESPTVVPAGRQTSGSFEARNRQRYVRTRLHARGRIGHVWLARDDDLEREALVEELRPERANDPAARAPFVAEAKITGQLEHAGNVPGFELGENAADGTAFCSMRFPKKLSQNRSCGRAWLLVK